MTAFHPQPIVLCYSNTFIPINSNYDTSVSIDVGVFPNNEPMVKASGVDQSRALQYADTMVLRPNTFADFMAGIFLLEVMDRPINLILPLPYGSRMDRLMLGKDDVRIFTAKSVAKILNSTDLKRVVMFDPHSDVMPALVNRSEVVSASSVVTGTYPRMKPLYYDLREYDVVIAPDAGATKRSSEFADHIAADVVQGFKVRDTSTGLISHYELGKYDFSGKRVLVVDDICDGGATFEILAKSIPTSVSKLSLFVTHGLFTKGVRSLLAYYDRIFTTDSTLNACNLESDVKSDCFSVIPVIRDAVERIGRQSQ